MKLPTDWQRDVQEPLTGAEEEEARTFIEATLTELGVSLDDPDINWLISRTWDKWVAQGR